MDDAQLSKDYTVQKDSTKAWKDAYKSAELARGHLQDTLSILDGLLRVSTVESNKWHDSATKAKGRLIAITRPVVADSTNPRWMHRSIALEQIVAAQERELVSKDAQLSLSNTKQKLLLSQMSKDSVALHSASANINRLNNLVERYKDKSECRVAWVLPCMSRAQAFIVGGIVGAGTVVLVNTTLKK